MDVRKVQTKAGMAVLDAVIKALNDSSEQTTVKEAASMLRLWKEGVADHRVSDAFVSNLQVNMKRLLDTALGAEIETTIDMLRQQADCLGFSVEEEMHGETAIIVLKSQYKQAGFRACFPGEAAAYLTGFAEQFS